MQVRMFGLPAVLLLGLAALGQASKTATTASAPQVRQADSAPSLASTVDREISTAEKQIVATAEAMPEGKFNFSPESLNIPGDDYKGVRTFAQQVKHVAASNYAIWSPLTGENFPKDFLGGNRSEEHTSELQSRFDLVC